MRKALLLLLGIVVVAIGGCASSEDFPGRGPEALGGPASAPTRSPWSQYVTVMTDKERTTFLDIEGSFEREQWIRRQGIDVRADLARRLARGISVEAAKRRIIEVPDETRRTGRTTYLFYSRYNTTSRTHFWLRFEDDQLLSWNSYTQEAQDRERELLEFEQRLMRKFDTVLRKGMGVNEIRRQADNARQDLNKVEMAYRERIADPNYKAGRNVGNRDYIIAEQLLYAKTRNELFEWFQGREPDKIIIHRPFETHQYNMVHTDIRGVERIVTAEFVFENGALVDWFVFHES